MKSIAGVAMAAVIACGWVSVGTAEAGTVSFRYDYPGFFSGQGDLLFSGSFDSDHLNDGSVTDIAVDPNNPANNYSFSGDGLSFTLQAFTSLTDPLYHEIEINVAGSNRCCHFGFIYDSPTFAYSDTTGTKTLTVSGDFDSATLPSSVPLPSSAPLFGFALLSVVGIGYARNKFIESQAASRDGRAPMQS